VCPSVRSTGDRAALRAQQPGRLREVSEGAEERLHRRYSALVGRGKKPCVAVAAVARELAGFVWDVMVRSWAASQLAA